MIAYKGGAGGASLGNVTGAAQVSLLSSPSVYPHIKAGRLRLLAVVARDRLDTAPEIRRPWVNPDFPT